MPGSEGKRRACCGDSTPAAWDSDGLRSNCESLAQCFDQDLYSLCLVIGHPGCSAVCDDAYSDGLSVAVPASTGDGRPLLSPFFRRQYLAVGAAGAVAETEVEVCIFGVRQAVARCQLLYVTGPGPAVVYLYSVPPVWRLWFFCGDCGLNRIERAIGPEGKRPCRRRVVAQRHQDYGPGCHRGQQCC